MYIEDLATFTTLVKTYSPEYFCNTKVARLGEIKHFHVYSMCLAKKKKTERKKEDSLWTT